MTELAPTTLLYAQAVALIDQFKTDYSSGKFQTVSEVSEAIREIVTKYSDNAGRPMLNYEPYQKGEPPLSSKMNEFLTTLGNDVNIMQDQLDVLRAAVVFVHNFIATEVLKLQNQNSAVSNKVKTLQLFSNSTDINLITFGDYFTNSEFIDNSLVSSDEATSLLSPGVLTLGRDSDAIDVFKEADVKVLSASNGFLGNNQEILDPSSAPINPATNQKRYTFLAEQDRHSDLANVIDGEPNTWIEYENYLVSTDDKLSANNYNFSYSEPDPNNDTKQVLVSWADGPDSGVLKLGLEFDLKSVKTLNNISYTPFGLRNNSNHPVKVSSVQLSSDGIKWNIVNPQNVWIATDANLQTASTADNITIGTAVWAFGQTDVRFVRIYIEQNSSIPVNIGHLYYETTPQQTPTGTISGSRILGQIPSVDNPAKDYSNIDQVQGNVIQKVEYFPGQRWAIGIRDVSAEELTYLSNSIMVSKKFKINGIIDRVALEADVFIPDDYDSSNLYIRFYLSPDEGINWFPISRIQDDNNGIKEIIAFNDPLPTEFHEPGIGYYSVPMTVDSLRLKIELSRPADKSSSSPIVKSYKLKIRKR